MPQAFADLLHSVLVVIQWYVEVAGLSIILINTR